MIILYKRLSLVQALRFNKQGTKLGVRYTAEGQQQTGSDVELIPIPGAQEPKRA